jgi:hypothetical protein
MPEQFKCCQHCRIMCKDINKENQHYEPCEYDCNGSYDDWAKQETENDSDI